MDIIQEKFQEDGQPALYPFLPVFLHDRRIFLYIHKNSPEAGCPTSEESDIHIHGRAALRTASGLSRSGAHRIYPTAPNPNRPGPPSGSRPRLPDRFPEKGGSSGPFPTHCRCNTDSNPSVSGPPRGFCSPSSQDRCLSPGNSYV